MTMEKGQNLNRPEKGSKIKVEPVRKLKDIKAIKKILSDKPRDLALFTLGINTNLRASDLLGIKADQVRHMKVDDEIVLQEQKTGKERRINLNKPSIEAVRDLLGSRAYEAGDSLFMGQRGVLTVPSLSRLVKSWCREINLKGNYAAHSLRKTWGYHQRVTFNVGIPELMVCFNHSSQRQTLDYLCVQPDEIRSVYKNEL